MCLGFLPHNFSPASIFMGDTGSMLLGLLLAYAPISSINSLDPALLAHNVNRYPEILPLLLPAALLVIPYADLLLAVVRRTRAGQSPFAPDRKHLHHRMLDIGHSQRASVLIMYLWAAVFSGTVVWLSIQRTEQRGGASHHGQPVLVFVGITAAAVVALLLLAMPKLRSRGRTARLDGQAPLASAVTRAGAAAIDAPELVLSGAMELRRPEAAPLAATGPAEPQLVAAAAVSRMTPLAAPVAHNGSSRVAPVRPDHDWADLDRPVPDTAVPDDAVPDSAVPESAGPARAAPDRAGLDRTGCDEVGRDEVGRDEVGRDEVGRDEVGRDRAVGEPGRVDPPAASWTFGDRSSDGAAPAWRGRDHEPDDPRRHAPVSGDLGRHARALDDADQNGRTGARSIIGTPPPAVSNLEPILLSGNDRDYLDRRDTGHIES